MHKKSLVRRADSCIEATNQMAAAADIDSPEATLCLEKAGGELEGLFQVLSVDSGLPVALTRVLGISRPLQTFAVSLTIVLLWTSTSDIVGVTQAFE